MSASSRRTVSFVFALQALLMLGCGQDESPRIVLGCRLDDVRSISADDAPLGFSARQVFENAGVRGGQSFDFGWDFRQGPSIPLEVGIDAVELSHVEWVKESQYVGGGDECPPCPQALTFPATVIFRTSDGQFDERLAVQVWAVAAGTLEWEAEIAPDDIAGSFQLEWPLPWDPATHLDDVPRSVAFHGGVDTTTGSWGDARVLADGPRAGHRWVWLGEWGSMPNYQ